MKNKYNAFKHYRIHNSVLWFWVFLGQLLSCCCCCCCCLGGGGSAKFSNISKWSFCLKSRNICPKMLLKPLPAELLTPSGQSPWCEPQLTAALSISDGQKSLSRAPSEPATRNKLLLLQATPPVVQPKFCLPTTTFYCYLRLRSITIWMLSKATSGP